MAPTRKPLLPQRFRVGAFLCAAVVVVSATIAAQLSPLANVSSASAVCQAPLLDCTSGAIAPGPSGGGVNLVRSKTKPGTPAKPATKTSGGTIIAVPPPNWSANTIALVCAIMLVRPWYCPAPPGPKVTPAVPATPAITLTDIAGFIPRTPALQSEPAGWALVGLPTNFIATELVHDVSGRLLGTAATVRFTPVSFSWNYADGTLATTATPGASWSALGLPAFSPTATSHTFSSTGLFTVRVNVTLRASYRLGTGSWSSISGSLTRSATVTVRVSRGSAPVLVSSDCLPNPSAIGC